MVAGIENLTDKLYREYLDFRSPNSGALTVFQPGVNFYFGTELSY
jgi:outer membrane receptor protein involved in Fe transport